MYSKKKANLAHLKSLLNSEREAQKFQSSAV